MLKQSLLILALVTLKCQSGDIDGMISIDADISVENDEYYHKHIIPVKVTKVVKTTKITKPTNYNDYEDVEYNVIKVYHPTHHSPVNKDIKGFLHKLTKVVRHKPRKPKGRKPIYRQAITLIAHSAEKDHQLGKKKLASKNLPKMYMPVPQAISHILGKEHIPYGVYSNLAQNYNY